MKSYGNVSGSSGVLAYETGADWIKVKFTDGKVYKYSYTGAGMDHIEQMKVLAQRGSGLATYINRYVRNLYD